MKILKSFTFLLLVGMFYSCSVAESDFEYATEEKRVPGVLSMADLTTTIIDGEIITDQDIIDSYMDNAFATHFNYVDKQLVISTTEEELQKYWKDHSNIKNAFEKSRTNQANLTTYPVKSKPNQTVLDADKTLSAKSSSNELSDAFHKSLHKLSGHSDSGSFIFKNIDAKRNIHTKVGLVPNTATWVWSPTITVAGVTSQPYYMEGYLDQIGEHNTVHELYVKNHADKNIALFFFDRKDYEYVNGRSFVIVPAESVVQMEKIHTHPGGSVAKSIYGFTY